MKNFTCSIKSWLQINTEKQTKSVGTCGGGAADGLQGGPPTAAQPTPPCALRGSRTQSFRGGGRRRRHGLALHLGLHPTQLHQHLLVALHEDQLAVAGRRLKVKDQTHLKGGEEVTKAHNTHSVTLFMTCLGSTFLLKKG